MFWWKFRGKIKILITQQKMPHIISSEFKISNSCTPSTYFGNLWCRC